MHSSMCCETDVFLYFVAFARFLSANVPAPRDSGQPFELLASAAIGWPAWHRSQQR